MYNYQKWNYFILFNIFSFYYINCELIFVYEHSRHGGRGPMSNYQSLFNKTTLYDEYGSHWDGDGILTLKGKMQHYILGISNRYKYPNLINYTKYNSDELLIHVTKVSRVKESAYNQILGMFNPSIKISENQNLIKEIPDSNILYYPPNYNIWKYGKENKYKNIINEAELSIKLLEQLKNKSQSFLTEGVFNITEINKKNNMNIELTPFSNYRTFYTEVNCLNHEKYIIHNYKDKYSNLIKETFEKKYEKKLQNFFKYNKKEWLYSVNHSISLVNHFISNYNDGRSLKKFFDETGIDKEEYLQICLDIYYWWLYHIYCDKKTCIMESSKIMEDLIKYMDNKINNKNNRLKMVIDVGHDVTVGPMQYFMHEAFGTDYKVCNYACNIYFELYKEEENKKSIYIVKYFVDDELLLSINYELFKKNIITRFWTEEEKDDFCRGNILKLLYPNIYYFCIYFLLTIIIFSSLLFLFKCYNINLKKENKKSSLNNDNQAKLIGKNKNLFKSNSKNRKYKEDINKNNRELDILS